MEEQSKKLVMVLFFFVTASIFHGCFSSTNRYPSCSRSLNRGEIIMPNQTTDDDTSFGSSVVFPVSGNVYPLGYYSAALVIGNPPQAFDLDVDTGSQLTWVQCDAPCVSCTKPLEEQYKPKNIVPSSDPLCEAIQSSESQPSQQQPDDQCDYEVEYADHGLSLGVLVTDQFPLELSNGSLLNPILAFGCGYDQQHGGPHPPPPTHGVLGLGRGSGVSIVSQLLSHGITGNVIGHCLRSQGAGGGFLFFGRDLVPASGVNWTPLLPPAFPFQPEYLVGPAEILFDGKPTGIMGLELIFDSGSSYTYFTAQTYESVLNLIRQDLSGKPLEEAPEDQTLPICWKASQPITSFQDVNPFFKPLALSFPDAQNVQLQLPPQHYLIISEYNNVCLGILDGTQGGLGENLNVIGDISLVDKIVVYDNEKLQIGWIPATCV